MKTIEKFNQNVMGTYGRYDVVLESGENRTATDENGKTYIDFGSGIGTNSLGFCDDAWVQAVTSQAKSIQHTSNYYYTKIQAEFSEKLINLSGMSKVFFGNSGAEANECAIKIARKYSFDKYGNIGRNKIITLVNSFHGRTLATLSATGQDSFHNYFFPFVEGFEHAIANDIHDLESKIDDKTCAIMVEFVQGEGGVIPLNQEFVDFIAKVCEEKDLLFIADEVQTGVGRTGKFLAGENFGATPDVITLAKGLAGGMPIGACLANEKCDKVLCAGTHGSTFGGNPISCAAGKVVLERIESENFLAELQKKAEYLWAELNKIDEVESVSGLGFMIGMTLKTKKASEVCKAGLDNGLLLLTAKEKLRLLPPLTITYDEIDAGLTILRELLS